MELAVARQIVWDGLSGLDKRRVARRLENLDGVGGEIHLQRKIGPGACSEGRCEERGGSGSSVALEHEVVLRAAVAAEERTGAKLEQIGTEVGALDEDEQVLVADVQRMVLAGLEGDVEGLDTDGCVAAAIGTQLCATHGRLRVCGDVTWDEYGLVARLVQYESTAVS